MTKIAVRERFIWIGPSCPLTFARWDPRFDGIYKKNISHGDEDSFALNDDFSGLWGFGTLIRQGDGDECLAALLTDKISKEEAKLFIRLKRSWTYGVSLYAKQVSGRDRLLIVIEEDRFKRKKAIELGEEFF